MASYKPDQVEEIYQRMMQGEYDVFGDWGPKLVYEDSETAISLPIAGGEREIYKRKQGQPWQLDLS